MKSSSRDHAPTIGVALEGDLAAAYRAWVEAEWAREQRIAEYNARLVMMQSARADGDWSVTADYEYRRWNQANDDAKYAHERLRKAALSRAKQVEVTDPGMPTLPPPPTEGR